MNPTQPLAMWLAPLGWLALEATVVILAALALQPFLRAPATRRSLWRAVLVALALLLAAEFTGATGQLTVQLRTAWQTTFPKPAPQQLPAPFSPELPLTPPPVFSLAPIGGEGRGEGAAPTLDSLTPSHPLTLPPAPLPIAPPAPAVWPALLWLTGIVALLARSAWTHAGFAWLRLRHFIPAAEALRERVAALAARLGLRRRVRVLASERLRTPAAFGWLRPGVVVPGDFTARFAPAQQDVMLAHELAHLAARDPLWQLLADLAAAALWWHPLVWVARRQHRIAGELAADDASLALPDGPVVLAECLLALGHEAADCPRAALGMAGFRSQLGRRVARLVTLPPGDWQPAGKLRSFAQTTAALVLLAALALLPGCAASRTATEAPSRTVAKWWQAKNAPVGDDVRRLTSADSGQRTVVSKKRVTSLPTNDQPVLIQGRVLFSGTPPAEHNIPLPPAVLAARTNAPMKTRFHLRSPDGGLADVLVYVKHGLEGQTFAPPTNPHVIRVTGFEFQPYISAVGIGQLIRWENHQSEAITLHPTPTNFPNKEFSRVLLPDRTIESDFLTSELFVRVKTDTHPWLFGYVSVLPHPFFAVTDAEGRFRFPQPLPPGKYTLAAIHRQTDESLQELDLTQPLPAGQPLDVPFVMAAKVFPPYRFAVGDVLKVDIYQRSDLRKETRVLPSGDIELPLIGAIPVAGKTISEVRATIKKAYEPAHVETAHVTVRAVQTGRPFAPGPLLFTPKQAADFAASAPLPRAEFLERKARVEAEIKEAEKTFPPAHPKMLGLRNQLESVEEALKQLRLAPQELASVRFQLGRFISVETRLQTANFSTLERLALLATCSGMIQGTASPRGTNTWEDLELQKLSLERTIKEQLPTYPAGHLKMKELFSQQEALEVALVAELKQALARFETVKQDLIRREEQLSRLMGESKTTPPAPAKPGASLPAPVGADVRSLTFPAQTRILPGSEAPATVLVVGDSVRIEISYTQNGTNRTLAFRGEIASAGYVPIPRASKAVIVAGRTIEEATRMIREQLVRDGLESPRVTLDKAVPLQAAPPGTLFLRQADTYRIQPGDELIVSVWGRSELRTKGNVQADGRMMLPLVQAVQVAGQTITDARAAIRAAYQPVHLAEAHVAVQLIRSVQPPTNGMTALSYPTLPDLVALHPPTLERLAKVRLPEVGFNAASLPVVLQQLTADTLRLDPDRDGVKFEAQKGLFTATAFAPPASSEPETSTNASGVVVSVRMNGSPMRSRVRLNFDMDSVSVTLPSALRDVPALDALEAIVKGADYPVRYTIETNRVNFWQRHSNEPSPSPKPPAPKPGASLQSAPVGADVRRLTSPQTPDAKPQTPPASERLVTSSPTVVKPVAASSLGAGKILRKLEEIVLPEVHFDGVPLAEVMKRLDADARKFDPEKKGLNFLINDVSPPAPLLDASGNPVPVAQPVPLSEGLIRISTPLRNLTLRQALDVICKTAELPTQFSVEEYAIVFIPRGPGNAAYFSRMFKVNPNTFIQGLQGVVGNPVQGVGVGQGTSPVGAGTSAGPVRATVPATGPATQRTPAEANALVRQFFLSAGVSSLGATNSSTRVIFNLENGLLLARGTTNDLRIIEQAIEKVQPSSAPTPSGPESRAPERDRPGRSGPASTNAPAVPSGAKVYRTNSEVPFPTHSSKGAQLINRKLDELILPEVRFDSVTLPEVAKWLEAAARKSDPEPEAKKKGLHFLINTMSTDFISANVPSGAPGVAAAIAAPQVLDPVTGQPLATAAMRRQMPTLATALVKVTTTLTNLTLRQTLDVICKTAEVKLSDGGSAGLKYYIEDYGIVLTPKLPEQSTLFSRMFKVDPERFLRGLVSVTPEEKLAQQRKDPSVAELFRFLTRTNFPAGTNQFVVAGVTVTNGYAGTVNTNQTSVVNQLVREYFRAAGVANLGPTNGPDATQVFFNDRNGLLLVRASLQDLDIIQMAIELLNVKPPLVLIEAKFATLNQNDLKALGFDYAGILTAPQFAVLVRALEQRDGNEVTSLPKVTTTSGKQAVIELPADAKAKGELAKGLKLEIVPTVGADGYVMNFMLTVTRDGKRVLEKQFAVWDAQTVMLGFPDAHAADQPGLKTPRLMLFLTPTIVHPAGHRVHTDAEMPFIPAAPAKK